MEIEQLKLIIETVKSVSGDAETVAIWWIVIDNLVPVVAWIICICVVLRTVGKWLDTGRADSVNERWLSAIREELHGEGYGYFSNEDFKRAIIKIRELKSK